jgi:hypothetical protein
MMKKEDWIRAEWTDILINLLMVFIAFAFVVFVVYI